MLAQELVRGESGVLNFTIYHKTLIHLPARQKLGQKVSSAICRTQKDAPLYVMELFFIGAALATRRCALGEGSVLAHVMRMATSVRCLHLNR